MANFLETLNAITAGLGGLAAVLNQGAKEREERDLEAAKTLIATKGYDLVPATDIQQPGFGGMLFGKGATAPGGYPVIGLGSARTPMTVKPFGTIASANPAAIAALMPGAPSLSPSPTTLQPSLELPDYLKNILTPATPPAAMPTTVEPTQSGMPVSSQYIDNIKRVIVRTAQEKGIDPALALSVAQQESSLNPSAVGDNGESLGLFQLQSKAAIDAGIQPEERKDPLKNIQGGIEYLSQGLRKFGNNVRQALEQHYNRTGDPNYFDNVMRHYQANKQYVETMSGKPIDLGQPSANVTSRSDVSSNEPLDQAAIQRMQKQRQDMAHVVQNPQGYRPEAVEQAQQIIAQIDKTLAQGTLPAEQQPTQTVLPSGAPLQGYLGPQAVAGGGQATVRLMGISDNRINGGRETNIPLLVPGQIDIQALANGAKPTPQQQEIAIRHAAQRIAEGATIPSYDSVADAERAAQTESQQRGQMGQVGLPGVAPTPAPSQARPASPAIVVGPSGPVLAEMVPQIHARVWARGQSLPNNREGQAEFAKIREAEWKSATDNAYKFLETQREAQKQFPMLDNAIASARNWDSLYATIRQAPDTQQKWEALAYAAVMQAAGAGNMPEARKRFATVVPRLSKPMAERIEKDAGFIPQDEVRKINATAQPQADATQLAERGRQQAQQAFGTHLPTEMRGALQIVATDKGVSLDEAQKRYMPEVVKKQQDLFEQQQAITVAQQALPSTDTRVIRNALKTQSSLSAVRTVFDDDEIKQYVGLISGNLAKSKTLIDTLMQQIRGYGDQAVPQDKINQLRALSNDAAQQAGTDLKKQNPDKAARYLTFLAMAKKIEEIAFSVGGQQLTGNEINVVFGYLPTVYDLDPRAYIAKLEFGLVKSKEDLNLAVSTARLTKANLQGEVDKMTEQITDNNAILAQTLNLPSKEQKAQQPQAKIPTPPTTPPPMTKQQQDLFNKTKEQLEGTP